jgi:uncharacterized membrane protein YeiH
MIGAVVDPPIWIDVPAIVAGALAGALFAQRRGLDLIGILAIAIVNGLGGGILRDVLLGRVPIALEEPIYLAAVAISTLIGASFAEAVNRMRVTLTMIDAVALGLFSVIGTQSALLAGLPTLSAILLGTITGVGGSVLRDVLVGELPPRMLRRGTPYASVAALGAATYALLVQHFGVAKFVSQIVVVVLVCLVRGVSAWRGWGSPSVRDVSPRFLRTKDPRDVDGAGGTRAEGTPEAPRS